MCCFVGGRSIGIPLLAILCQVCVYCKSSRLCILACSKTGLALVCHGSKHAFLIAKSSFFVWLATTAKVGFSTVSLVLTSFFCHTFSIYLQSNNQLPFHTSRTKAACLCYGSLSYGITRTLDTVAKSNSSLRPSWQQPLQGCVQYGGHLVQQLV